MTKGQRANRIKPPQVLCPQAVEFVSPFLQREHALRIVSQLADQHNFEPVRSHRRVRSLPEPPVVFDLVDTMTYRGVEAEWLLDVIARSVGIDAAAHGFPQHFVTLQWMIDPLTRQPISADEIAPQSMLRPEHPIQVVCDQFVALDPTIVSEVMHYLHELQGVALNLPKRRPIKMMPYARVGEHRVRVTFEASGHRG